MRKLPLLTLVLCATLMASTAMAKTPVTPANLQAVYSAETNAQATYAEYAKQAQADGYLRVAKLFVAAAMSEGIRANFHAEAIRALKAAPKAEAMPVTVGTTQANLEAAVTGLAALVEKYPEYIKQAQADKARQAVLLFKGDRTIKTGHLEFLKQALAELEQWKTDGAFYTCEVCGKMAGKLDFVYCPVCTESVRHFIAAK